MKQLVPKEQQEWEMLANWLKHNNYTFTHIANEIWITWHIGMLINKKKVKQWLNKWFPDYCIILKKWSLLFIELKRIKPISGKTWKQLKSPSIISQEQIDWHNKLNKIDNVACEFAYWCNEAINIINKYENN